MQAREREVDGPVRNMEQLQLESERQVQEKEVQIQWWETDKKQKEIISQLENEVCQKDKQLQQLRCELHQTSRDSEQLVATLQHSLEHAER